MFRPYSWAIIRLYHEPRVGYITCCLLVMGVLESSPYYCLLSWYVYFFILYIIILLRGLIVPVFPVSITLIIYYLTYMYNILFVSIFGLVDCNGLLCTFSVVYCHFLYLLIGSFVLGVGVLYSVVWWDFFGESCY